MQSDTFCTAFINEYRAKKIKPPSNSSSPSKATGAARGGVRRSMVSRPAAIIVAIVAEDRDRIFAPVFMTKSTGMGLGLSFCMVVICRSPKQVLLALFLKSRCRLADEPQHVALAPSEGQSVHQAVPIA